MPRILIAASGTGGHIYPAVAVAENLPESWDVIWLGVPDRLEKKILPKQYKLITIQVGGLQGQFLKKVLNCFQLFFSVFKVIYLIKKEKINVVFSTGGYIAAPAIFSAWFCSVPVLLHESNAQPGRVTRLFGRLCSIVAIGFSSASKKLETCRTLFTGTPVRSSFLVSNDLPMWVPSGDGPLLVVIGGSQGADGLNKMINLVSPKLLDLGCRVVHLTGLNNYDSNYKDNPRYIDKPYSDEMPGLIQNADLVISRAGAGTISELAICGAPAILVPYPYAKDNHQNFNAFEVERVGGGLIVYQKINNEEFLFEAIYSLLKARINKDQEIKDPLVKMKSLIKVLSVEDSTERLVKVINSFL
tara:strand:- start:460 stop:1533 length:1074 start_codon:yes stop_codon:yes gene_type:complete